MEDIKKNFKTLRGIEGIYKKVVVSGDVVETYDYEYPVFRGFKGKSKGRANQDSTSEKTKELNRRKVASRAKRRVARLVNANFNMYDGVTTKFLTLTFDAKYDNISFDIDKANVELKKFINRLGYHTVGVSKLKYLCVPEFQKRRAIHYHLIIFNMPFIKTTQIADIWGYGFVKINKIRKSTDGSTNAGVYVAKYLCKEVSMIGKKSFWTSKGNFRSHTMTEFLSFVAV